MLNSINHVNHRPSFSMAFRVVPDNLEPIEGYDQFKQVEKTICENPDISL